MKVTLSLLALAGLTSANIFQYETKEDGRSYKHDVTPKTPFHWNHEDIVCGAPKSWYPYKGDWSGWTTRPMCIDGVPDDNPTAKPTKFCTFADKKFAEGRGIVILSTPAIAALIRDNEAFTDPDTIKGQNDLITGPFSPPPYIAHLFPNKGIGLIANRTLERGERIMQETPSLIYNRDAYVLLSEDDRIPFHWHLVHLLPEQTRLELLGLHKHHGGDEVDDLMRTNAFGAYYDGEISHNNVFPRISRFNHDCRPNAAYYFDPTTMTQYVHAIRKIAPHEEILITYTDVEQPYTARQTATMMSWGFGCTCSICRQPADHVEASDKRLALIHEIKEKLNDWTTPLPNRTKMAEYMVDLYRTERMEGQIATAYESAAYAYAVEGDEYGVKKYAQLAWESLVILYGADHELTVDMAELMEDPAAHRTWRFVASKE